ncbi:MAG: TIGR00730 family Rossman fold protein [Patescibacteria group bacterium]
MDKKRLTIKEIHENIEDRISKISKEFRGGFEFIKKYPKSVSIFGSSRLSHDNKHYLDAKKLAEKIVKETGYSIITGGGPGAMESANMGAKEAGGASVGLNIKLPHEQRLNPFTTDSFQFEYFFTRKTMLTFSAEAYVFFPGGFGTFDELFGILALIQTSKIPHVPIILFGSDFWNEFRNFISLNMLEKNHSIEAKDMDLFIISDSYDDVIEIIKNAPVSEWWKMMD